MVSLLLTLGLFVVASNAGVISEWSEVHLDVFNGGEFQMDACVISVDETVYIFEDDTITKLNTNDLSQIHRFPSNLNLASPFACNQNIVYNEEKNLIYIFLNSQIYIFDTNANAFILRKDIPSIPISVHSSCITMDNTNNLLYIFGGIHTNDTSTSNKLQILSLDDNQWLQSIETAPISTAFSSCFLSNDLRSFYVFGGMNSDQIIRYKLNKNKWQWIGEINQPKHGMSLIQSQGKLLLIGGIPVSSNDKTYSNEIEIFDPMHPGHTVLDTPINSNLNSSIFAIHYDLSILVITAQNSYFITNKLTNFPTVSPTFEPMISAESASNVVLLSPNSFIYTIAMLTSMIIIVCVCCVGVLSFYYIMRTNKRLHNIISNEDRIHNGTHCQIPNSSKCSSLRIDMSDNLSNASNANEDMLTVNKLYNELEPGISSETVMVNDDDEEKEIEYNDDAMTPSEGAHAAFYEQKYEEYMQQISNKQQQQQQLQQKQDMDTNDGDIETGHYVHHIALRSDEFIVCGDSDIEEMDEFDTKMCKFPEQERLRLDDMQSLSSIQYEGLRMKHRKNNSSKDAFDAPLKNRYGGHHHHHVYSNQMSR